MKTLLKIKHADGFDLNGVRALQKVQVDRGDASSEFKHADPVKFGEFVASLGLDYEKGYWPTLHKLVRTWSHSPNEPEVGRNQSA